MRFVSVVTLLTGVALGASPGERLYVEGVGASGAFVKARVQGDVDASGAMLSCVVCHGRSGLGSVEGSRVVAPITQPFLSTPRSLKHRPRPAYDERSLARAIRDGVDSAGNTLDALMPRYALDDRDTRALLDHLATLSVTFSPGATLERIQLATVVTPEAQPAERDAMLQVLSAFFRAKNRTSSDRRSWHTPAWPEFYGEWELQVWMLSGPASTWRAQLDAKLRAHPVFALVSGVGREWRPVHEFCEAARLPCLLPNVDTPPAKANTYYSVYFSRGVELEADVVATRVEGSTTLQLVGAGDCRGADRLKVPRVSAREVGSLREVVRARGLKALVLWLNAAELKSLGDLSQLGVPVFASATLLAGAVPGAGVTQVAPFAGGRDLRRRFARVSGWLELQGLHSSPSTERIEDQTLFAITVFNEGLMHLNKNLHREYLLEVIDHSSGLEALSAHYPRLSFGPGQRTLSKGCLLISEAGSEWVVP